MSQNWFIEIEPFSHPFTCMIVGPTQCGKTFFLKSVLDDYKSLIKPIPNKIFYCYNQWQPLFESFKLSIPSINFNEGIMDLTSINENDTNLVIFDDLMTECIKNEHIMNLFTVGSHHKNTSVFFITQNIFSKGKYSRDISLNSNYLILFNNPRDKLQLSILARQMYPGDVNFFIESFKDATKSPHGYLFLDLKQNTEEKNRVQTGILPLQKRILYTQSKII